MSLQDLLKACGSSLKRIESSGTKHKRVTVWVQTSPKVIKKYHGQGESRDEALFAALTRYVQDTGDLPF